MGTKSADRHVVGRRPLLAVSIALALTSGGVAAARATPEHPSAALWVDRYDMGTDAGWAVTTSLDGSRVYATGDSDSKSQPGNSDLVTIAYDTATGQHIWTARFDVTSYDSGRAIVVSPDGSTVFVAGITGPVDGFDGITVAYDATTGERLWVSRYTGTGGNDRLLQIGVSPDGTLVYVAGFSQGKRGDDDYVTIAYHAATGIQRWGKRYAGPARGNDYGYGLAVGADAVYVTGNSAGQGTGDDVATLAYDARTGKILWTDRYDAPAHHDDGGDAVQISADGSSVFVTGYANYTAGGSTTDVLAVAYDPATGARRWVVTYDGTAHGFDEAKSVAVSPDGSTVCAVAQSDGGKIGKSNYDIVVLALDGETGDQRWLARYDDPKHKWEGVDYNAAGVSPDGTVVYVGGATAEHQYFADTDFLTAAFDTTTGAVLWTEDYNGTGSAHEEPRALAVNPDGSGVYVTGMSWGANGAKWDLVTVAYSTSNPGRSTPR